MKIYKKIKKLILRKHKLKKKRPVAYEYHNYYTGHCYVDYRAKQDQDEQNGYTKIPLFKK